MSLIYVVSFLTILFFGALLFAYNRLKTKLISEVHENANLKKWSSVGQMAGGIAHEVNTPLTTMILTLDSLLLKLEKNDVEHAKKDVQSLIRTGEKIGNIVHSLRLLTVTGGKFERDKISLFDVVIDVKNEYADILKKKNIDFAYAYNIESKGLVWGSAAALRHILTNLVKNAIDAIEELDTKWIKILLVENKTHYKVLVQNSGPHIDKAIVEKIFEPFFTTKDEGSAMGIGLSVSKTLVLAHGGSIRVDMKNPHVMFEVMLPKIKSTSKEKKIKSAA